MNNKKTGEILIFVGVIVFLISLIFEITLEKTLVFVRGLFLLQFIFGLLISILLIVSGVYLFYKKEEIGKGLLNKEYSLIKDVLISDDELGSKRIVKNVKSKEKKKESYDFSNLNEEEKKTFEMIISKKSILQKDLIEKMNVSKVKMTRILHKLEGFGYIVRERHGMNNLVVLKNQN